MTSILLPKKKIAGSHTYLFLHISKNDTLLLTDTIESNASTCTGFSIPEKQPFKEYFIFSRREKGNGKTYILSKTGQWSVVPGGIFWAGIKHRLLFILVEQAYSNLLVYDLKKMKTIFEKFNCDEFTNWYYLKGDYYGRVVMECGEEPHIEKEISEWMNPVETEEFNPQSGTLNETHSTDEQLEKAHPLLMYAGCK